MLSCCDQKPEGPLVVRDVPGYPVEKEGYSGVDPGTVAVITKTDNSHHRTVCSALTSLHSQCPSWWCRPGTRRLALSSWPPGVPLSPRGRCRDLQSCSRHTGIYQGSTGRIPTVWGRRERVKSGCEEASPEETLTAIVGEDGDLHLPQPVRHQPPLLPDLPPASDPGLGAGQVLARWRQADWQYVGLQRSAGLSITHWRGETPQTQYPPRQTWSEQCRTPWWGCWSACDSWPLKRTCRGVWEVLSCSWCEAPPAWPSACPWAPPELENVVKQMSSSLTHQHAVGRRHHPLGGEQSSATLVFPAAVVDKPPLLPHQHHHHHHNQHQYRH